MRALFVFLYKYSAFFLFIFLELLAFWLVINKNSYHKATFISSSNVVSGTLFGIRNNMSSFFNLREENDRLRAENAALLSLRQQLDSSVTEVDTSRYEFVAATIVNNSILKPDNYLTISKGKKDGIKEGMGVVSGEGIVGRVKASSQNFSTIYSLLHSDISIASQLKPSGALCTTQWSFEFGYTKASVRHVAPHIKVNIGDTIVTSGNNSVFPKGINIGVVNSVAFNENDNFQNILIDLTTDFSKLSYVYVVDYSLKAEKDSLEKLN